MMLVVWFCYWVRGYQCRLWFVLVLNLGLGLGWEIQWYLHSAAAAAGQDGSGTRGESGWFVGVFG